MFAMGIMLLLIGYGLIWTGVERFRGDKVSLLGAFGLPGGTVTTIDPGGGTGPGSPGGGSVLGPISVNQVKDAAGIVTSVESLNISGTISRAWHFLWSDT